MPNALWTADALHGPNVAARKVYLLAFIDDHSRLSVVSRRGHRAPRSRLAGRARCPRGPGQDLRRQRLRVRVQAAAAGGRVARDPARPLDTTAPGGPREDRTVLPHRARPVLVELDTHHPPADVAELNRLFAAWVEGVHHRRVRSETAQTPFARVDVTAVRLPTPAEIHEAFLWSETRTVTKVATVSPLGSHYQVDAALVGQRVELVFDPFDLTRIDVRLHGRAMGAADWAAISNFSPGSICATSPRWCSTTTRADSGRPRTCGTARLRKLYIM